MTKKDSESDYSKLSIVSNNLDKKQQREIYTQGGPLQNTHQQDELYNPGTEAVIQEMQRFLNPNMSAEKNRTKMSEVLKSQKMTSIDFGNGT